MSNLIETQQKIENQYTDIHIEGKILEALEPYQKTIALVVNDFMELVNAKRPDLWFAEKLFSLANEDIVEYLVTQIMVKLIRKLGTEHGIYSVFATIYDKYKLGHHNLNKLASYIATFMNNRDLIVLRPVEESTVVLMKADQSPTGQDIFTVSLESRIPLNEELYEMIEQTMVLPPLVAKPKQIFDQSDSGFYVHKRPALKKSTKHSTTFKSKLHVVNAANKIGYKIDSYVATLAPLREVKDEESIRKFEMCEHLVNWYENKTFYFSHFLDFRGRLYLNGYHLTYQGEKFERALLDFSKGENINLSEEESGLLNQANLGL